MKPAVFFFLLVVVVASVAALPTLDIPEQSAGMVREKRATCDLLSFTSKWISINHSACAAHCLALRKGFKGGRCQDGICKCRK